MSVISQRSRISRRKIKEITVLIAGASGSGKSQLINGLMSYGENNDAPTGMNASSVTKSISKMDAIVFNIEGQDYSLTLYDTRGFLDTEDSYIKAIDEWNEEIKNTMVSLDYVLFVISPDRLSLNIIQDTNNMMSRLKELGVVRENLILIINKSDFWIDDQIMKYKESLQKLVKFPEELSNATCLTTCFLDKKLVVDEVKELCDIRLNQSADKIIRHIIIPVTPIKPRQVLMSIETLNNFKESSDLKRRISVLENNRFCNIQ